MKALVLGLALIAAALLVILPAGLGWGEDVLAFLRGVFPVVALLAGLILLFAGAADIKDKAETEKSKNAGE